MKIIECVGLPGSGKSTVSNYIIKDYAYKLLSRNNILYDGRIIKNIIFRTFFILLKPTEWKFIILVIKTAVVCKTNFKYVCRLIILYEQLKRYTKQKEKDIVILEEGIIQYLSSMAWDIELNNIKEISKLTDYILRRIDFDIIYFEISIDESIRRLDLRNRDDRYTKADMSIKGKILDIKRNNLQFLLTLFNRNIYVVDANSDINNVIKDSIDIVKKILGDSL